MAIALVGIFDKAEEAQEARRKLAKEGIDDNMIQVTSSAMTASSTPPPKSEDHRGFFAKLFGQNEPDEQTGHYAEAVRRGSSVVTVHLADDSKAHKLTGILEHCGAIDVNQRVDAWKAHGYQGYNPTAAPYDRDQAENERATFKVMEEELKIGKRAVEGGGVRVHQHMSEKPVSEKVSLHQEKVVVNRRPVDRAATATEIDAFGKNDQDIQLRETSEEAVVSKAARVVEEVDVGKQSSDRTQTINETVRRTDVDVEKLEPGQMKPGMDARQPPRPHSTR